MHRPLHDRATGVVRQTRESVHGTTPHTALRHPRTAMAIRAAVAATLAWLLAQRLPGGDQYAFYAPFGAVVTTYSAVVRSTTETLRAVAAIMLGAAVGLVAHTLIPWTAAAVATAVAVGVVVSGLPALGSHRTYVPVAAVFLLLIGQGQALDYAVAYAGLFLLGALVTIVLNAAFPTLPLPQAESALHDLREEAAVHLRHMGRLLRDVDGDGRTGSDDAGGDGAGDGDPAPPRERLTSRLAHARDAVDDLTEAARGNRRARRERRTVERIRADFRALERVVLLVDDLHDLSEDAPWQTRVSGVTPELRRPMGDAVDALAAAITTVGLADTEPGQRRAVDDAVRDLATALVHYERTTGPGPQGLVVATVVTTLRRTLSALTPADRMDLSPSPLPADGEAHDGEAHAADGAIPTSEAADDAAPAGRRPPGP
ncbi:hypothetical protein [uncultured Cellulomonas sp.]|uniref:hypothetical protein n=1 Tax=uncultured Cellulomonas sp. TaxID=189682 RepID=UPI002637C981|nr:hypothetical protein [uncultured Cellulomonas sp.]